MQEKFYEPEWRRMDMRLDKKTDKMDQILKGVLHTQQKPDDNLHQKVMQEWKEQTNMKRKKLNRAGVAAAAACVMVVSAVSVNAAMRFWTPSEVVSEMGYQTLADIFEKGDAVSVNETQIGKNYSFTLLGLTEGSNLLNLDADNKEIQKENFYAVVAISKTDGSKLTKEEFYNSKESYFISPLIQGMKPWQYNIASMNGGYTETEIDGVIYRMIDCDKISYFADKQLYLCILNNPLYDKDAYNYDETSGIISANSDYKGTNLLFQLPIDSSKADADKAAGYLKKLEKEWSADNESNDKEEADNSSENEVLPNASANADYQVYQEAYASNPDSIETVLSSLGMTVVDQQTVDEKDGAYHFTIVGESGTNTTYGLGDFKNGLDTSYFYSEGDDDAELSIEVVRLNKDGSTTRTTYSKEYKN